MKKGWKYYLGLCLFIYSFIPICSMVLLPFLGLPLAESGAFAIVFLGTGEISFYISVALLGKQLIMTLRKKVFAAFCSPGPPKPIGHLRHRVGIAMLLASFLPYYATLVYLLFFGHKEELLKIFTWSLVGGEILCLISFFVLGAQFWEDVKNLFRWKGNNMSTQGGL